VKGGETDREVVVLEAVEPAEPLRRFAFGLAEAPGRRAL